MNVVHIKTSDKNIEQVDDCNSMNCDNSPSKEPGVSLPCPPLKPEDTDCCGSGCVPCVFDIYEQDLKIWRKECRKIKENQRNEENLSDDHLLTDSEYRKFCITEIRQETKNCFRFRLKLPEFSSLGLKVGQHIIIRDTNNGSAVSRQYTPISDVSCLGHFDLLIKIYDHGKMSHCVRQWSVGMGIEVRGPFGNLQYSPNKNRKLFLLAAGTGIAPMSQVIQCILGNEEDDTLIQLFYACKSYEEILMKSELNEWSSFWNFSVTYVLSQETGNGGSYRYGDQVCEGRMDLDFLTKNVSPSDINSGTFVLVCGTKSFDNDMIEHCKLLSFKETQIHRF
ncbi:NADH-cytochrome b5 reductase-like [Saccostrea echinata]|uniref:NADH-cytochrome b5 reductase-like n=1 Tax=Saccostrea echinata TaxID=191078 RepID=UPI002A812973|nr:NADH-cytochrome b5 reductase-like [Saccostrea echinata]